MYFEDEGGEKNGGPDDPRLRLVQVDVVAALRRPGREAANRLLQRLAEFGQFVMSGGRGRVLMHHLAQQRLRLVEQLLLRRRRIADVDHVRLAGPACRGDRIEGGRPLTARDEDPGEGVEGGHRAHLAERTREGVTLRHRTGGADEGWHLKVPVPKADPGVRDELRLPLDESPEHATNAPPAEWPMR